MSPPPPPPKGRGRARNGLQTALEGVVAGLTARQGVSCAGHRSTLSRSGRLGLPGGPERQRRTAQQPLTGPTAKPIRALSESNDLELHRWKAYTYLVRTYYLILTTCTYSWR